MPGKVLVSHTACRRGGAVVQGTQSQPGRTAWPCQQRWQGLEKMPPLSLLLLPPPTLGKESEHCMSPDQSSFPKHCVAVFPLGELSFSVWLSHNLSFVHAFTVDSLCFRVVFLIAGGVKESPKQGDALRNGNSPNPLTWEFIQGWSTPRNGQNLNNEWHDCPSQQGIPPLCFLSLHSDVLMLDSVMERHSHSESPSLWGRALLQQMKWI